MTKIWILLVVALTLLNASVSFCYPTTWANTSNSASSPLFAGDPNIGVVTGRANLGDNDAAYNYDTTIGDFVDTGAPDGQYIRFTSDGFFGSGGGNGSFTMAFDFFNQGTSNISQIVYTGHASESVTASITQVDFFSSALTNNQATISTSENLSFITSPSEMCIANRLRTDGFYQYYNGVWYFINGVDRFTTQSNFSFNDIVRVQYTFSITGYTAGKFFELDTVSNTNDPVPIAETFAPVSIFFPQTTSVPEPATMFLFGAGLAGIGIMRKRMNI